MTRNNGVTIWDVREIIRYSKTCAAQIELCGVKYYVPARPLGWTSWLKRFKAIWLVWTGRADVVTWPGQP